MNKIVISRYEGLIYACLLGDKGQLIELMLEKETKKELVGNIYIGKVMNIQKGISAAFIDVGLDKHVFMPVDERDRYLYTNGKDKSEPLRQGDELVIQVAKDGNKQKAPKMTPKINLSGEHVVLTYGNTYVGVSNKIDDSNEKKRLKKIFKPYYHNDYGYVVRTNAQGVEKEVITSEIESLVDQYNKLLEVMAFRPYKTVLRQAEPVHQLFIKNAYKGSVDEIVFDDKGLFENYESSGISDLPGRYEDCGEYSLYQKHDIKKYVDKGLSTRIWLRSGANITIEQTEALVAVDVNSAKVVVKKNNPDFFLKINKEAALKIMEQIRLRNLSGIIIVDFIDMPVGAQKKELMAYLTDLAAEDRIKTDVIDMTKLGLVEIVRKKAYRSLEEQFTTYLQ